MGRISETIKTLIIINVIFFIGTLTLGDTAYRLFSLYFFESPSFQFWQPITHMFMHGGIMHIVFNMYALWAFGSPLEQNWGRKKFLFFYFSAGLGAAFIYMLINYFQFQVGFDLLINAGFSEAQVFDLINSIIEQSSRSVDGSYSIRLPEGVDIESINTMVSVYMGSAVGASGAVYGILVAFGMMYPNAELMLIFLPIPIKAKYFIPLLLLGDLFFGISGAATGVAHFAHIGGAIFGFIMAYYWKKNSFNSHRWN